MNAIDQQLFGPNPHALFERRGLMLDISRNRVPTMSCLKQLIDALARLRYNELQLYTEHTFAYREHRVVWQDASPMTAAEIRELDAYCRERGIELIPNQNSFGHMERWLKHPPYRPLAECPEGFIHPVSGEAKSPSTLHPCSESLEFMDALYAELLPNFRSRQIHIGGDEPWELGKGRSRSEAEKIGLSRVYLDYMQGLFQRAKRHGSQAQFWADIILQNPELVGELPSEVTPVIWGYDHDSPYAEQCATVAAAGFSNHYYVAPGAGNWNSFGGRLDIARANIALAASEGQRHSANGLLLTAWGDNGHHQVWESLYPPLILATQAAWGSDLAEAELGDLIDSVFELNSGHGTALCQLGAMDTLLPQPLPPVSFLHAAFFATPDALDRLLERTHEAALRHALAQLDQIEGARIDTGIGLSIDMNRYALERCLALPHRTQIDELKQRFKLEWLRHSRPGGLDDSLARFPKISGQNDRLEE